MCSLVSLKDQKTHFGRQEMTVEQGPSFQSRSGRSLYTGEHILYVTFVCMIHSSTYETLTIIEDLSNHMLQVNRPMYIINLHWS